VIIASYEVARRATGFAWVFLSCLTVLFIPAAIAPVFQLPGLQGVPFLVGFLMVWALICYQVAVRAIYRLDLSPTELRWHGLLRSGAIPLGDLRTIRPRGSTQFVIESAGWKPLRVAARAGSAEFAASVKRAAPQLAVGVPGVASRQGAGTNSLAGPLNNLASRGFGPAKNSRTSAAASSWLGVVRATALAGLCGALLEAGIAAGTAQPNPIGVLPGATTALVLLYRRGVGGLTITMAVVAAVASSGLIWLAFASLLVTRWVTVADAVICPLAAVAVARLLMLTGRHPAPGTRR
jgi:hypothetical protein